MFWNGFFDLSNLKEEEIKQLFRDALFLCIESSVNILENYQRVYWDGCTAEEYIEKYVTKETHNVVIDRVQYRHNIKELCEVGSTTYNENGDSVYLFIHLTLDAFYKLVEKYNLPKRLI